MFGTRQSLEEKKGGKKNPPPSKRVRDTTHISNSEMYWPGGAFVGEEDVHFSWTYVGVASSSLNASYPGQ